MKLYQLVTASHALQKIIIQDLPLPVAYKLMRVTEETNKHLRFYNTEAMKAGDDDKRLEELKDLEVDGFENYEKLIVPVSSNIRLSASDVHYLEPLITFTEEEDQ